MLALHPVALAQLFWSCPCVFSFVFARCAVDSGVVTVCERWQVTTRMGRPVLFQCWWRCCCMLESLASQASGGLSCVCCPAAHMHVHQSSVFGQCEAEAAGLGLQRRYPGAAGVRVVCVCVCVGSEGGVVQRPALLHSCACLLERSTTAQGGLLEAAHAQQMHHVTCPAVAAVGCS